MSLFTKAQGIKSNGGASLPTRSLLVDPAHFELLANAMEEQFPLVLNENAIRKSQKAPTGERIVTHAVKAQSTSERKAAPGSATFYYSGKVVLIGSLVDFKEPELPEIEQ